MSVDGGGVDSVVNINCTVGNRETPLQKKQYLKEGRWVVARERGILIRRHLESDTGGLYVESMIYETRINEIVPISEH